MKKISSADKIHFYVHVLCWRLQTHMMLEIPVAGEHQEAFCDLRAITQANEKLTNQSWQFPSTLLNASNIKS